MSEEIKTIGVLTSGGDAPGMNAAIRAVVRKALDKADNKYLNKICVNKVPQGAHKINSVSRIFLSRRRC